jgi:hypothetical protein
MTQENSESAVKATQGREAAGGERHELWWAEATIWTDRMVSALGNGVKGGKWFSLVDKDHRRWPNAYFASLGLFTLSTARYQARHSR